MTTLPPLGAVGGARTPKSGRIAGAIVLPALILACAAAPAAFTILPVMRGEPFDAPLTTQRPDDQGASVRMTIRRTRIGDEMRTPEWQELEQTYGLRVDELNEVMEAYNRTRSGGPPLQPRHRIPEGADVVLRVD